MFLIKPNRRELETLLGRKAQSPASCRTTIGGADTVYGGR
jgi:hypothetical protein